MLIKQKEQKKRSKYNLLKNIPPNSSQITFQNLAYFSLLPILSEDEVTDTKVLQLFIIIMDIIGVPCSCQTACKL